MTTGVDMTRRQHGLILTDQDADYASLSRFGRIVIEETADGVHISCEGFESPGAASCRALAVQAMAWGRDVLAAAVDADRLVPGGRITASMD